MRFLLCFMLLGIYSWGYTQNNFTEAFDTLGFKYVVFRNNKPIFRYGNDIHFVAKLKDNILVICDKTGFMDGTALLRIKIARFGKDETDEFHFFDKDPILVNWREKLISIKITKKQVVVLADHEIVYCRYLSELKYSPFEIKKIKLID